jgi:hypothetical protein
MIADKNQEESKKREQAIGDNSKIDPNWDIGEIGKEGS